MKIIGYWLLLFFPAAAIAQPGSEIYLFDMTVINNKIIVSHPVNITQHKGYDSQPFFHSGQPLIYYASFNDSGRSDIKVYNYSTQQTTNLTVTHEREYSPTLTPDKKFISCIIQRDNGAQDLGKYPVKGGEPIVLINNLVVGYHAWIDKNRLLLFVLDDSVSNSLHDYDLLTKEDKIIAKNAGRSLHTIPGKPAMSFVQKINKKEATIERFNTKSLTVSTITKALPGQEDLVWTKTGLIIMSDGEKLYSYQPGTNAGWQQIIISGDTSMLKGVTRLALNKANTKLAVVVSE